MWLMFYAHWNPMRPTLQAQSAAEKAARESLDLAQKQYQLGALSYLIFA